MPYDKKSEVGYRPIPETAASLKKIFAKVVEAEDADEAKKNAAFDALQELVSFFFCSTGLPLARTRWVRSTFSSFFQLFEADLSINLSNIIEKKF